MTDYETLRDKLAECKALAARMMASGVWDELITSVDESICDAVLQLEGTYALTSDERAVRARDDAQDWRRIEAMEQRV